MEAVCTTDSGQREQVVWPEDESGFWKEAAKWVFGHVECPDEGEEPETVRIDAGGYGNATLLLRARGTWLDGGVEKPSPFVTIEDDDIALDESEYEDRFMVYCSPESAGGHGSYKYYRLHGENGEFTARYGRVGGGLTGLFGGRAGKGRVTSPIASSSFWLKYQEKLAKGYVDLTGVYLPSGKADMLAAGLTEAEADSLAESGIGSLAGACRAGGLLADDARERLDAFGLPALAQEACDEAEDADEDDGLEASRELYRLLQDQSSQVIESMLDIGSAKPSASMVAASRELVGELGACKTAEEANAVMARLMCVSPRRADRVASFMLRDASDISHAVDRETALADSLLAKVVEEMGGEPESSRGPAFDSLGIGCRMATDEEREQVLGLMLDPYTHDDPEGFIGRVTRIWALEPKQRIERYEAYKAKRGIEEERLLFHGSSFGSWFSCISTGLSLAYAGKNGSNLGTGHYFANQFDKSTGYVNGGRWVGGAAKRFGYIGVYRVAYGRPYMARYCEDFGRRLPNGYDCVHALSRKAFDRPDAPKIDQVPDFRGFANDEIVVYDDAACAVKYLVEYEC